MPFRPACLILAGLLPLFLAGCADSLTSGQPLSRFTDLVRGHDKTMTKDEQKAEIAELQAEQARAKQQQGGQGQSPPAAQSQVSRPTAKTAQTQN